MKKGGYIIIDLQSVSIVNDLRKALDSNKPVLVYDANNDANFYTLSYDSVNNVYTLTGVKDVFTIDSTGTITPVSSGYKVYKHDLDIQKNSDYIHLVVYSSDSTSLTFNKVIANIGILGLGVSADGTPTSYSVVENVIYTNLSSEAPQSFDSTSTITDTIVEI